jgi:hypothetical protein
VENRPKPEGGSTALARVNSAGGGEISHSFDWAAAAVVDDAVAFCNVAVAYQLGISSLDDLRPDYCVLTRVDAIRREVLWRHSHFHGMVRTAEYFAQLVVGVLCKSKEIAQVAVLLVEVYVPLSL